jgi:hypothetical protein
MKKRFIHQVFCFKFEGKDSDLISEKDVVICVQKLKGFSPSGLLL